MYGEEDRERNEEDDTIVKLMFVKSHQDNASIGLLLVRIPLGIIFIAHGWMKLLGMAKTIVFFGTLGLAPAFAYLVAGVEFLGGLALLFGILTRPAGAILAFDMLMAIAMVKIKANFIGGFEFEFLLLFASLGLAYLGAGKFSIEGYGVESGIMNYEL